MARHCVLPGVALLATWLAGCSDENSTAPSEENLLDPRIQPRVIATYPSSGTTGPFELFVPGDYFKPHFLLQFNKLIDLSEFERDWFSVEGFDRPVILSYLSPAYPYPERESSLPGPIYASGQQTNLVSLVVYDSLAGYRPAPFQVGRTYTFHVNTTLEDLTGNHPAHHASFSFTPEPHFRVVSINPAEEVEPVQPFTALFVTFNSRVDATIFPALKLTPGIPGKWDFVLGAPDSNSVWFQHLEPFPFGSSYTLTITQDARDAEGNALRVPLSSSFDVMPFKILQAYPQDGATGVTLNNQITVMLSGMLDTTTANQAFHLEPPTSGQLLPSNNPPSLTFLPSQELLNGTRYTVTISTALRAFDGTPLSAPYSASFTTISFQVIGNFPSDGQYNVARNQPVTFYCSGNLDMNSVPSAFGISPATQGTVSSLGSAAAGFNPSSPFAANTIYTVTISTALRSSRGTPLAAPHSFTFRTGG